MLPDLQTLDIYIDYKTQHQDVVLSTLQMLLRNSCYQGVPARLRLRSHLQCCINPFSVAV